MNGEKKWRGLERVYDLSMLLCTRKVSCWWYGYVSYAWVSVGRVLPLPGLVTGHWERPSSRMVTRQDVSWTVRNAT